MCDGGYVERLHMMRRMEQLRKEMEQEELERQRKAAVPATPAKAETGAVQPEPVPV